MALSLDKHSPEEIAARKREYHKRYYAANREKIIERTKAHYKKRMAEDPDLVRAQLAEYRRKRRALGLDGEQRAASTKRVRDGRARNREYVRSLKEATPCADCGNHFPHVCMDFDHIGDDKTHAVARLVAGARSLDLIKAEIAKCEIVCANCHRIRTFSRLQVAEVTTTI